MKDFRQAAADGDLEKLKVLKLDGADINEVGPSSQKAALHWAADGGHEAVVNYLIEQSAAIDPKDSEGNTPLNLVVQSKQGSLGARLSIIARLLGAGADPLLENNAGKTVLMNITFLRSGEVFEAGHHAQERLRGIIRTIKYYVADLAKQKDQHVAIQPDGKVVFGDLSTVSGAASGNIVASPIDPRSSFETNIGPHT